ncbi:Bgt-20538, partial [Blumeria graminis f. sp. tritici]
RYVFLQSYDVKANYEAIDKFIARLKKWTAISSYNNAITNLDNQLALIAYKISTKKVSFSNFERLISMIIGSASDREIWDYVITMADILSAETKSSNSELQTKPMEPNSSMPIFKWKSSELLGYGRNAESLTKALKFELSGHIYKSIDNFWEETFENKPWSDFTMRIWESYRDHGQCGTENPFSREMSEAAMRNWLYSFQDRFLYQHMPNGRVPTDSQPIVHRVAGDPFVRGKFSHTTYSRQLVGGLSPRKLDFFIEDVALPDGPTHDWRDVRVVAELPASPREISKKMNQLVRYFREIFYAQPLRRFVHGFCLHKLHVEFWVIDRSGAYSSREIDVIGSQEKLVRALSSYVLMSDEELGLDTITRYDGNRLLVTIPDGDNQPEVIQVASEPVAQPETIMSRANTCYRTLDSTHLIKFSWGSGASRTEIDSLKLARNIEGVINLEWSKELYEVETHRKKIQFSSGEQVIMKDPQQTPSRGQEITSTSSQQYYKKRRLTIVKLSPYGRPLRSCTSVREFLSGVRDAIIGHYKLLNEAKILHRDISEGNIIMTRPDVEGITKGMLIDLDMSISLNLSENPPEADNITGTVKYMAIELVKNVSNGIFKYHQNYRHDLESFFYVFLSGCITYGLHPRSAPTHLNQWCTAYHGSNFRTKKSFVTDEFEEKILNNFSPSFEDVKSLASDLRQILFIKKLDPYKENENTDILYGPIIRAFDDAIAKIDSKGLSSIQVKSINPFNCRFTDKTYPVI